MIKRRDLESVLFIDKLCLPLPCILHTHFHFVPLLLAPWKKISLFPSHSHSFTLLHIPSDSSHPLILTPTLFHSLSLHSILSHQFPLVPTLQEKYHSFSSQSILFIPTPFRSFSFHTPSVKKEQALMRQLLGREN